MRGRTQDWPMQVHRFLDHAALYHRCARIVSRTVEGARANVPAARRTRTMADASVPALGALRRQSWLTRSALLLLVGHHRNATYSIAANAITRRRLFDGHAIRTSPRPSGNFQTRRHLGQHKSHLGGLAQGQALSLEGVGRRHNDIGTASGDNLPRGRVYRHLAIGFALRGFRFGKISGPVLSENYIRQY